MAEEEQQDEAREEFDREYVEELRGEAKGYRLKLRDTEKRVEDLNNKLSEFENRDKSEVERLTSEKAKLEQALAEKDRVVAETAIETEVKIAASKMGAINPDDVYRLIDLSQIDYNDGDIKGVEKALKKLLADKTYLVGEKEPPPAAGSGGPPVQGGETLESVMLRGLKGK